MCRASQDRKVHTRKCAIEWSLCFRPLPSVKKSASTMAIGKVVFTSREHIIAFEARGKGLLGIPLRYPYEVRNEADYFDDIPDEKIPKDMLDLASHIVKTKAGHFEPSKFEDQYEDALKELLKKKQEGKPIERPERPKPTNVVNLMDALRLRQAQRPPHPSRKIMRQL